MERLSGQIHIKEQLKADTEVQPGDYPLAQGECQNNKALFT